MRTRPLLSASLLLLLTAGMEPAGATDEALLQVLLQNKLITQAQYDAIIKAQNSTASKPVPTQEQSLLDVLLANGVITQEQFAALQVKNADDKAKKIQSGEAKITLKDGLKIKSVDGDFSAQLGTYFQFDSAWYGNQGKTDFSNGTELRRGRLSLAGTVYKDWDYKFEADFAGTTQGGTTNTVTVTDAYARYNGFAPVSLTAGNFKVPFSLEAVSSAKYLTFMERGLPFSFLRLRLLGAMASANGDNWTASAGLFGDGVTDQNSDDEGLTGAARFTFAPILKPDRLLHVGASGLVREPPDNSTSPFKETIQFRSKPESDIISDALTTCTTVTKTNTVALGCNPKSFGGRSGFGRSSGRLVDTGNIGGSVNYAALGGFEAAAMYGPFSLQGEYVLTSVDRDAGGDLSFNGYYVYGSLFLTDDSRNYNGGKGTFEVIQPKRPFHLRGDGWGAWELALRFSGIDLNDKDIHGGNEQDLTAGLNWYPNSFVRLTANYVKVLRVDGGAHDGEDIDAFQTRVQVAY